MSQSETEVSEDPWSVGHQYAHMLGPPPSSFTTLIRGLMVDRLKNEDQISFHQEQAMVRFLRGESMKAPFYFALKTFKSGLLQGAPIPVKDIVRSFNPYELAAYLGLLYTFRRARAMVKNDAEWEYLRRLVNSRSEIGGLLGYAIPNVGPGIGLIAGGFRFLGFTPFLVHDEKGFVEYRRHLKKEDLVCDFDWELARWGCTHGHVAAHILISLGVDKETAMELGQGLLLRSLPPEKDSRSQYAVKLVEVWTTSLLQAGTEPDITHSGAFYPLQDDLTALLAAASEIRETGSRHCWLEKRKADFNETVAPEFSVSN